MLGSGMPLINPISAAWNTVARFDDYESAQRAVDRLSDDGFPVEKLDIVGSGLRLVERVTGRLTNARAAGAGALSGMGGGLLFGILLGVFTSGDSFFAVAAARGLPRGGLGRGVRVRGPRQNRGAARLQLGARADRAPLRPDRARGHRRACSLHARRGRAAAADGNAAARGMMTTRLHRPGGSRR